MEALRLTMNSTRLASIIDLPDSLRDCEVDVIILPNQVPSTPEVANSSESHVDSIKGILKQYANPALRDLEKGAWEQAAVEKYIEKMNNDRS